jgi:hypothetical protein
VQNTVLSRAVISLFKNACVYVHSFSGKAALYVQKNKLTTRSLGKKRGKILLFLKP